LLTKFARTAWTAACIAWLSSCSKPDNIPRSAAAAPDKPLVVAVAKADREDLEKHEVLAAEFRPFQIIDVHAKVAGYLRKINVDVGDRVKEGQELAVLEVPELTDELTHAQATRSRSVSEVQRAKEDLARAQAQRDATRLTYERLQGVAQTQPNLIAQQEIDDAMARDQSAAATVSAAQAAVASSQQTVEVSQSDIEKARTMTGYARITAPFAGVITKRYADTGAMIPAGTSTTSSGLALVQLSENDLLRLVLPVPEAIVAQIYLGEAVTVRVDAVKRDFIGKVNRFADTVSTDTRTMDTQIDVPNPNYLLIPGMYAQATITVEKRPRALAIPLEAITISGNSATAYVVDANNRVAIRSLKLGLETPDRAEVLSGLAEGELVVVSNRSSLTPGQTVEPKQIAAPQKGVE
jgi:RND family efflux transporter MFP subunit